MTITKQTATPIAARRLTVQPTRKQEATPKLKRRKEW
jgi:hypothetical protein